jgi:hypothetical protein
MSDRTKEHNDRVLERMQGVPAQQCSQLEAMMDPTNPNVFEANDNRTEADFRAAIAKHRDTSLRYGISRSIDRELWEVLDD